MRVDDFEEAREASAPLDMMEQYFSARDWSCERVGDEEIVAQAQGSWTQYELRAVWRDEDRVLQLLALPDIRVPADKRAVIYEALGLINEQLWMGHFEMWSSSGLILFRNAAMIDLGGEGIMTLDHAEALAETAVDECERFYPVFQFVLWADKSPAEAIAAALIDTQGEA